MTLQNLPEKTTKYHLKYVAAVVISSCLLISGTVYAAVNYVEQRMLSIDENEKKKMADYTRNSVKDIDTYSRELTEDEKEEWKRCYMIISFTENFLKMDWKLLMMRK